MTKFEVEIRFDRRQCKTAFTAVVEASSEASAKMQAQSHARASGFDAKIVKIVARQA